MDKSLKLRELFTSKNKKIESEDSIKSFIGPPIYKEIYKSFLTKCPEAKQTRNPKPYIAGTYIFRINKMKYKLDITAKLMDESIICNLYIFKFMKRGWTVVFNETDIKKIFSNDISDLKSYNEETFDTFIIYGINFIQRFEEGVEGIEIVDLKC